MPVDKAIWEEINVKRSSSIDVDAVDMASQVSSLKLDASLLDR